MPFQSISDSASRRRLPPRGIVVTFSRSRFSLTHRMITGQASRCPGIAIAASRSNERGNPPHGPRHSPRHRGAGGALAPCRRLRGNAAAHLGPRPVLEQDVSLYQRRRRSASNASSPSGRRRSTLESIKLTPGSQRPKTGFAACCRWRRGAEPAIAAPHPTAWNAARAEPIHRGWPLCQPGRPQGGNGLGAKVWPLRDHRAAKERCPCKVPDVHPGG